MSTGVPSAILQRIDWSWAGLQQTLTFGAHCSLEELKTGFGEFERRLEKSKLGLEKLEPGLEESKPGLEKSKPGLEEFEPGLEEFEPGLEKLEPGTA